MDLCLQVIFNEHNCPDTAGTGSALGLLVFEFFFFFFEPLD
jgi:hypothetical protein